MAATQSACTGRARLKAVGVRARAEHTSNMLCMVVTLEVSQLEMSALKFNKCRKSSLMSVMAETSQSAIGPYVAMAAVGLALYAWTAVFREALVVKVYESGGLSRPELPCRVERREHAMRDERAWGDGSASGVHGDGLTQGCGPGHARSARRTCGPWS